MPEQKITTVTHRRYVQQKDMTEEARIEVILDAEKLVRWLGSKAMRSKGNRATLCGGSVRLNVLSRRKVPS
jgi:hypothetical protein